MLPKLTFLFAGTFATAIKAAAESGVAVAKLGGTSRSTHGGATWLEHSNQGSAR